jgi:uncharacterized protein
MSEDEIRYDILASEALRGIIRTVLQRVQKRGLPGEHHFYINFSTGTPGVNLSKRLREQYPEEMTIVLQHKFWDLFVHDDRFEVKLSFNNVPERLVVPFASIKSFVDPSVQFGFNPNLFAASGERLTELAADSSDAQDPAASTQEEHPVAEKAVLVHQEEQPAPKTAKVVELDLFRKK